ncbi:MAG: beta-ketoacyl-[acyl-carrier-protein] synthase family protein [Bacteroidetes bacterium]|nr:beta-ketoacyl-[acyl-carrier-protein] synthase family protein [Bacteroidota bacterium]MBS1741344.1 beta-ketoacyl-[acyl-carrier-protein] synthase family protein [Bacteroidota bacterium]
MSTAAHIVHTGLLTAIGIDTASCLESLKKGKTGIGKANLLQTHWANDLPVGEIGLTNRELAKHTGLSESHPRTALISAWAVQEALSPFQKMRKGLKCGFFSANTVGGMDITESVYHRIKKRSDELYPNEIKHHECGAVTEIVSNHFDIHDFVTTISTACSSSANSIMMAAQMIEENMLDMAIAGGADCLSRFTLNGFNTLMILDHEPCQPFDNNRRGLNLGEGAGYVILMNEKAMKQCDAQSICIVSGYANANDAFHQTASSPDGIGNMLAMSEAIKRAGILPEDIDYINLHGTGTANNDSSEGKAITTLFGNNVPKASSTKGFTGHTLGGCGGVEAVLSTLAIRDGLVFPNLRWQNQMEDVPWKPVTELQSNQRIKHVLSNSFGFGGNCSSLVFSKL